MENREYRKGVILALCAYTIWGIAPLYFKLLDQVSATEILLHRIIWSFVFMLLIMLFSGSLNKVYELAKNPGKIGILAITSVLISGNWLLFIWAVNNDHMLDASLGYFINPLINVMLGMVFLGERLRKLQWLAVALAAFGVLIQLISFGSIPIVSIGLAMSFGAYGLLRKKANVDAKSGLLLETAMMMPLAIGYIVWMPQEASANMLTNGWEMNLLLIAAGIITSIPLLCFANAALRIPLSVLGFFQYMGPGIMFVLAVLVFNEPFDLEKGTTFGFIWLALVAFTADMVFRRRNELDPASG